MSIAFSILIFNYLNTVRPTRMTIRMIWFLGQRLFPQLFK